MTNQARERQNNTGTEAERAAARYLRRRRVEIITRNYRCRGGEIDLIGRDRQTLVFIEVRYRHRSDHGSALESVTARKQQRLIRAASHYLQQQQLWDWPCRFDVIAMQPGRWQRYNIQWIKDAFQL